MQLARNINPEICSCKTPAGVLLRPRRFGKSPAPCPAGRETRRTWRRRVRWRVARWRCAARAPSETRGCALAVGWRTSRRNEALAAWHTLQGLGFEAVTLLIVCEAYYFPLGGATTLKSVHGSADYVYRDQVVALRRTRSRMYPLLRCAVWCAPHAAVAGWMDARDRV